MFVAVNFLHYQSQENFFHKECVKKHFIETTCVLILASSELLNLKGN